MGHLNIISWQSTKGVEKGKKAKVESAHFYDCIPSHMTMTGYYNKSRGASRLLRYGTDRNAV